MITRFVPPFRSQVPPQWRGACAAVAGGGPNRATAIVVTRRGHRLSDNHLADRLTTGASCVGIEKERRRPSLCLCKRSDHHRQRTAKQYKRPAPPVLTKIPLAAATRLVREIPKVDTRRIADEVVVSDHRGSLAA